MEEKQVFDKSKIINSNNEVNVIGFIEGCNEENYYDMLVNLLEHENLVEGKTLRKYLDVAKPIVNNEYFSVHQYQVENIKIISKDDVKDGVESTFLSIFCIKSKEGQLFSSVHESYEKLYTLSKECINLQMLPGLYCTENNMRLFSCCISTLTENEVKRYFYFTAIAFTNTGILH